MDIPVVTLIVYLCSLIGVVMCVYGGIFTGRVLSFLPFSGLVPLIAGVAMIYNRASDEDAQEELWEEFVSFVLQRLRAARSKRNAPAAALKRALESINPGKTLRNTSIKGYRYYHSNEDVSGDLWKSELTESDWVDLREVFMEEGVDAAMSRLAEILNQAPYRMAVELEFDPLEKKDIEDEFDSIAEAWAAVGEPGKARRDYIQYLLTNSVGEKREIPCTGDGCPHCEMGAPRTPKSYRKHDGTQGVAFEERICAGADCALCAAGEPHHLGSPRIVNCDNHNGQVCALCANNVKRIIRKNGRARIACHEVQDRMHKVPKAYVHLVERVLRGVGDGKALHTHLPGASAARRDVIVDGQQYLVRAPVRAMINVIVKRKSIRVEALGYEEVAFHPGIAALAVGKFTVDQQELAYDFVRRKMVGLVLNDDAMTRVAAQTAEMAISHSVELTSRWVVNKERSAEMSVKAMRRVRKSMALPWWTERENLQMDLGDEDPEERMREAASAARARIASNRTWVAVVTGIALTSAALAAMTPVLPLNPAKRPTVVLKTGMRTRSVPSVKYDYAPNVTSPYIPIFYDRTDPLVAQASFVGRMNKDNGRASEKGLGDLYKGAKWLLSTMERPDYTGFELSKADMREYIETRPAWSRKKKDLHLKVIDEMPDVITPGYLASVAKCEAFIKDEFYPQSGAIGSPFGRKVKPPRNICNFSLEFKIITGALLQPVNDAFFHAAYTIKHIPQCRRGHYINEMFEGKGRCLTTDHSAFEAAATAVNQSVTEMLIYRALIPRKFWFVLNAMMQPTEIRNVTTGDTILVDTMRLSGAVNTSVGNSIQNASSCVGAFAALCQSLPELNVHEIAYIREVMRTYGALSGRPLKHQGDPWLDSLGTFEPMFEHFKEGTLQKLDLTFLVEGDDAIVASPVLPEASVYQQQMREMGYNVTIEGAGDASKAGFCQVYWNEVDGQIQTYCDIAKQVLVCKYGTTPASKALPGKELFKARLNSLLQLFPGCPVLWKLLADVKCAAVEDNAYEAGQLMAQGIEFRKVGQWLLYDCEPVAEPTPAQRALFAELYGLSVESQLQLELDPYRGLSLFLEHATECNALADYAITKEQMNAQMSQRSGTSPEIRECC